MNLKTKPKILVTGGHLTPALATIDALQQQSVDIIFVGRTFTGSKLSKPHEKSEISAKKIQFVSFDAPKFHRKPLTKNSAELSKIIPSLSSAQSIINQHRPDALLAFGGYLCLPLVFAARLHRIPIITHEQTVSLGLSNHLISFLATKVAYSWPQSSNLPLTKNVNTITKQVLTGNPIRPQFLTPQPKPKWFHPSSSPVIFITGGNQGSRAINQNIINHLTPLTSTYHLIHQTGSSVATAALGHGQAIRRLTPQQNRHYHYQPWFSASEIAYFYRHADLVISRSGANTVTELLVNRTNAILIPLPYSAAGEQLTNAELLQSTHLATILPQSQIIDLPCVIAQRINYQPPKTSSSTQKLIQLHSTASHSLAKLVLSCITYSNAASIQL